ncbi:hypothetical protein FSB65_06635 [Paraburkholderia sp. JPY418]|nr:hypothetical protein [Paraburkholderia youngii]
MIRIYIDSRTPPEIAISILAELTAAKNSVLLPAILRVERGKTEKEVTNDTAINAGHLTWLDDARLPGVQPRGGRAQLPCMISRSSERSVWEWPAAVTTDRSHLFCAAIGVGSNEGDGPKVRFFGSKRLPPHPDRAIAASMKPRMRG